MPGHDGDEEHRCHEAQPPACPPSAPPGLQLPDDLGTLLFISFGTSPRTITVNNFSIKKKGFNLFNQLNF